MRIVHRNLTMPLAAFAIASFFVSPLLYGSASAQQTAREKAWAACLAVVQQARGASDSGENEAERVAAFKACMAKHGIRP